MKRILLTTTSLVLAAGVASAETSISWSGAATAGIAREGSAAGTAATAAGASAAVIAAFIVDTSTMATATFAADIVTARALAVSDRDTALAATVTAAGIKAANDAYALRVEELNFMAGTLATTKAAAGEWQSYSEVSTTVKGSVTADNGVTITAAVSVDAGTGYDFADDDGFDGAKTNGVSLDNITIATAMGTFKIDENAVTHLVDGDDDGAADIMYTNTFGSASVSVAIDANKDTDVAFVAASVGSWTEAATVAGDNDGVYVAATTGTAQDVAWSAKVSMPLAGGSGYVAMDEEGGNAFGASTTLSGVGVTFDSKLEALDSELKSDRSNTVGVSYAMGATTLGASWNSVEDGDQWGISAAYAADGLSISASTDEGSDWSVSGSMALGGGASVVAGTNYSEDAYLGLSFAF